MDSSAIVKWFYFGNDEEPEEQTYETELPIKLLRAHSKFNFKSKSCMNVIVSRAHPDQDFTVGYVVNTYPDGKLRVRCVDGSVRRFWPYEISRITPENPSDECTSSSASTASTTSSAVSTHSSFNSLPHSLYLDASHSLNSLTWRKAIKQASVRNLSWKDQMAMKQSDKFNSLQLHSSFSGSTTRS